MAYKAEVIRDSVSPDGVRLTTLEVSYPHAIHKDIMTHRMLSRNFQSFRAFPPEQVIENIEADPFVPESFDSRVKGMGQGEAIADQEQADGIWRTYVGFSLATAERLLDFDVAKAQVNFVLQDLTWITGIITATEWDNFFALRTEENVRPEVLKIATMMQAAVQGSEPDPLSLGDTHLPYIGVDDIMEAKGDRATLAQVSAARCARVSYLTHDGDRDLGADLFLAKRLLADGHMSPFEHVATPIAISGPKYIEKVWHTGQRDLQPGPDWRGNFFGWLQYRKTLPNEHDYSQAKL